MFPMVRTLARCFVAAVLIAAYLPLPAPHGGRSGHEGTMACCAPKACCDGAHACPSGTGCGGMGAPAGAGPRMFAGGCGDPTPSVTPIQLDPTVTPRVGAMMAAPSVMATLSTTDSRCISLTAQPLVPPPRA